MTRRQVSGACPVVVGVVTAVRDDESDGGGGQKAVHNLSALLSPPFTDVRTCAVLFS